MADYMVHLYGEKILVKDVQRIVWNETTKTVEMFAEGNKDAENLPLALMPVNALLAIERHEIANTDGSR